MSTTKAKKTATKKADGADKKKPTAKARASKPKSSDPKDNGRSDHRIPIQLLVDYRAEGHYLFDFCRDLGSGGVFIQTTEPLPQGSSVDLTFTIPDSKETLHTKGKVIWVQTEGSSRKDATPGMGVQFEEFGNNQRKILEDFVKRFHNSATGKHDATSRSA